MAYSRSLADLPASLLANPRQVARLAILTGALTYLLWWMRSPELSHASASPVADKINQFGCFNRAGLALYVVPAISAATRKRAVWMPSSLFQRLEHAYWHPWRFAQHPLLSARAKLVRADVARSQVHVLFATTPAAWRQRLCSVGVATALSTRWYFACARSIKRSVLFTSFLTLRRQAQTTDMYSWQAGAWSTGGGAELSFQSARSC